MCCQAQGDNGELFPPSPHNTPWQPGAREPSHRFQSLGETPQRSHSAGGALGETQSKAEDVTPVLGTPRELGAPSTREIQGLHCPAQGGHRPTHARSGREVAFLVKSGHSHSASVRLQCVKAQPAGHLTPSSSPWPKPLSSPYPPSLF